MASILFKDFLGSEASAREVILKIIAKYKADFAAVDRQERYKWQAAGWYRQHWRPNVPDEEYADMLAEAFSKADNLLAANMYWPYKALTEYAAARPAEAKAQMTLLYDESRPFLERYHTFRSALDNYFRPLGKSHYQDLHAVSVYLFFEHPESYYIYKYSVYQTFSSRIGLQAGHTRQSSEATKLESYNRLCGLVLDVIQQDSELIAMHKARLGPDCFADNELHLLTLDILFYGSVYLPDSDFGPSVRLSAPYWPSAAEYDPHISVNNWRQILADDAVTSPASLDVLKKMLELGGESTCSHLAEVYGNTAAYYNRVGTTFGEKVKNKYHCPDCPARAGDPPGRNRLYVIPFVGRYVTENGRSHYSWRLRDELKEALMSIDDHNIVADTGEPAATDIELNTILCGPPGTGKTYNTVIYAVAIIENKRAADVAEEDYDEVLARYNSYRAHKRVEFVTFHQSYGYEDFIEGIKPVLTSSDDPDEAPNVDIQYRVEPGIFKRFCEQAHRPAELDTASLGFNDSPNIWKVSLAGTGDNEVRTECLKNGHIRIGWQSYGSSITDETVFTSGGKVVLNAFMNRMQVGDIVFSCYSATTIDAVGVVTGDYEWHEEYGEYPRLRKVHWLVKGIRENILAANGGVSMTLSSVYRLANITISDVYSILEKYHFTAEPQPGAARNYVFIIDEINRGNISKIFGELITLIDSPKRKGAAEAASVVLPYSQKRFDIPQNVYLLGTMNTADRSIAIIDTALRRRFAFEEMMPKPEVLSGVFVEDISISAMLERMNRRIAALYDREHTIGHGYFMPLCAEPTLEALAEIFKKRILPLLQEYFYDDYEKIRLVLGDNQKEDISLQFVAKADDDCSELFGDDALELDLNPRFEINDDAFYRLEAYRSI